MYCKLFKEQDSKTYVLMAFFNHDRECRRPIYKVEVAPKHEKDLWVFEEFASELLTDVKEE